ncbi:MAG: hypothetical protein ABL891_07980 [Burkholderiales bacterium]
MINAFMQTIVARANAASNRRHGTQNLTVLNGFAVHNTAHYPVSSAQHTYAERKMFYAFYVIAVIVLILHFTGWLKRNNLEWVVLVLAVSTFPAVIFLK